MMEVVEIPIDQIKVGKRARDIFDEVEMRELEESIQQKGLFQPITIDVYKNLVAGERRLRAHRNLGLATIPCVIRDEDVMDKLRIELHENVRRSNLTWHERCRFEQRIWNAGVEKHGEMYWSLAKQQEMFGSSKTRIMMRLQVAEAMETIPELTNCVDLDEAFKEVKRGEEVEHIRALMHKTAEEAAEAPKWAEDHYVIGDAFNGMQKFLNTQPHSQGNAFQFAEVDPPYGVDLHRRKGRNTDTSSMEEYLEWEDFPQLFEKTAKLVYECLDPHAFAIFWYGMSRHSEVLGILRSVGWAVPDIPAIWFKGEVGQTASPDTTLGSCYEPFFVARKGQPKMARPGRGNVFNFPRLQRKTHPTEKPVHLMEELLGTFCFAGSKVLVPFLGSGVTLRASYRIGLSGMGWDLSDKHKQGFLYTVQQDLREAEASNEEAVNANPV
jgi:ParB/RepB/Spo0J family partition protein